MCFLQRVRPVAFLVSCLLVVFLTSCGALETTSPAPKATGSTAIAKPYPTVNATQSSTIYENALTSQATGWASGSMCAFTGSGLSVQPSGGQAYICLAPTSSLTDASIRVSAQQRSGATNHAYGIVFHHTSAHNYYFLA